MQAVLSGTGTSNSRGRAQQILVLQQRVNELQAKENDSRNKDIHKKNGMILDKNKTFQYFFCLKRSYFLLRYLHKISIVCLKNLDKHIFLPP